MANQTPPKASSTAEMIDEVGVKAVCAALGKSASTVRHWRRRGVPKKHQSQLASMVEERRQAPTEADTTLGDIDAFDDALMSISSDLATLSESAAPSVAHRNPPSAPDHPIEVSSASPMDGSSNNDTRPVEDDRSGVDVGERKVVSARDQRRMRRVRRQRDAANGQQFGHASRTATGPIRPVVDPAEDASSQAIAPTAVEHTKKSVRLNRQTVILAGAVLVAATGIGLSQGLQSVANGPSELAVEEPRPVERQASVVLPSYDYATVTKPPKLETVALTAPAEPPKVEEPEPRPAVPVVTTYQASSPAARRDTKVDEEEEAALQSGLFPAGAPTSGATAIAALAGAPDGQNGTLAALDRIRQSLSSAEGVLSQGQDRVGGQQESFLTAQLDDAIYLKKGLHKPISAFEVKAGTIIPAALITGLNSDLPGQVMEHVYDTTTGQHLLIPQGAKILGRYNAEVGYAQERAQVVWDRLIMPNGNSVQLEAMVGTDKAGYAGLADQVDHHFGRLFGAVILSSFISVGANLATDSSGDVTDALGDAAAQQAAEVGSEIVGRQLNVQPTITTRPGFKLNILVDKDIIFEAYPAS